MPTATDTVKRALETAARLTPTPGARQAYLVDLNDKAAVCEALRTALGAGHGDACSELYQEALDELGDLPAPKPAKKKTPVKKKSS